MHVLHSFAYHTFNLMSFLGFMLYVLTEDVLSPVGLFLVFMRTNETRNDIPTNIYAKTKPDVPDLCKIYSFQPRGIQGYIVTTKNCNSHKSLKIKYTVYH